MGGRAEGAARLRLEVGTVEMKPGDLANIPAHQKHPVDWTTPDKPAACLRVLYENGN